MSYIEKPMNGRRAWIKMIFAAAKDSSHIFPDYAACEALESGYGSSKLAQNNNLFGMKQHLLHRPSFPGFPPLESVVFCSEYGSISLPTQEWNPELKNFVPATADWIVYPDLASCFRDRMETLWRLSTARNDAGELEFPGYAAALAAQTGETFVIEVSRNWSTDPRRAQKVLLIHQMYAEALV